jgi:hypothetical protein
MEFESELGRNLAPFIIVGLLILFVVLGFGMFKKKK